jgi:hypothetical protein
MRRKQRRHAPCAGAKLDDIGALQWSESSDSLQLLKTRRTTLSASWVLT